MDDKQTPIAQSDLSFARLNRLAREYLASKSLGYKRLLITLFAV